MEKKVYCSAEYPSPLGTLTLAGDNEKLAGLWIEGQKYFGAGFKLIKTGIGHIPAFRAAVKWLDMYFAGDEPSISDLHLEPVGSEFRRLVWDILLEIPRGSTMTYGQVASIAAVRMGREHMSPQAVGSAVGHNPISVIIPCHRVVGTGGNLVGYAAGTDKKLWLLMHEGVDVSRFTVPDRGRTI